MNQPRLLSTSEFAQAIGVSESSIRRLADSGELKIHKTRGGHRKIPLEEAIRYARSHEIAFTIADPLDNFGPGQSNWIDRPHESAFEAALVAGDAEQTLALLRSFSHNGMSIGEICDGPIRNAFDAIGATWPADRRAIFKEHRAVMICIQGLAQMALAISAADKDAPVAIIAAPSGDPFLLPGMMISLALLEAGFNAINLGPDTPLDVLIDSIEDEKPTLICLSLSIPLRSRTQFNDVERLLAESNTRGCHLIIGGRGAESLELDGLIRCGSIGELLDFARPLVTPQLTE